MAKAKKEKTTALPEGTKMVRVKIQKDRLDKRTHVFASVNDYTYMIKIGEWVEVPDFIAEVLEQRDERMECADSYTASKQYNS